MHVAFHTPALTPSNSHEMLMSHCPQPCNFNVMMGASGSNYLCMCI